MKSTNVLTKAGAVIVSAAMLASLASCDALLGKKDIVEAAENLGDAVISGDASKILKLSTEEKDGEIAEALDLILNDDLRTDEFKDYSDAMKKTMTYEVDEGSVKIDGKKASCDITFTMADFKDLDDGEFEDIDDLCDAIEDLDTKDYEYTVKFEKDGDDWLVSNLDSDDFGALFDYRSYDLPVTNLAGDYVAVYDLTDVLSESLAAAGIPEEDMTGSIEMVFMLSLYEDGTFDFFFSGEDLYNSLMDYITNNMDALLKSAFGTDDEDELIAYAELLGYDSYEAMKQDLCDQIAESVAEDSIDDISESGTYTVDGNEITLEVDSDAYAVPSVGTIEDGNIIMNVQTDNETLGSDSFDLVFEKAVG